MRTTVTLEADVARMLRDYAHQTKKSFKDSINTAIRRGLSQSAKPSPQEEFKVEARSLGLREEFEGMSFSKILDDLEVEDFVEKHAKPFAMETP